MAGRYKAEVNKIKWRLTKNKDTKTAYHTKTLKAIDEEKEIQTDTD